METGLAGKETAKRLILWNIRYSINYALALHKANISCELHLCPTGEYGYCMVKFADTESSWSEACHKWMKVEVLLSGK